MVIAWHQETLNAR